MAITRAVIYTRFSPRPNAEESESCEKQLESCVAYCARKGYDVDLDTRYFEDRGKSGDSAERPGLWSAIDALKRGDVLVVRWRSRLARDVYLAEVIRRKVASVGARIEAGEEVNGSSPDEKFIQQVFAAFAEREKDIIAIRTRIAMRKYQAEGRVMGSRLPWGYMRDPRNPKRMVPCQHELEMLQVACELRMEGRSIVEIGKELVLMGYSPRYSEVWSHRVLAPMVAKAMSDRGLEAPPVKRKKRKLKRGSRAWKKAQREFAQAKQATRQQSPLAKAE